MIQIIVGTDRPKSNSAKIANIVQELLSAEGADCEVLNLRDVPLQELDGSQYSENQPEKLTEIKNKLNNATGFFMVVPEYNGSYPGALKYFIDHWKFPSTFEYRPVAFVGI